VTHSECFTLKNSNASAPTLNGFTKNPQRYDSQLFRFGSPTYALTRGMLIFFHRLSATWILTCVVRVTLWAQLMIMFG